MKEIKIFLASSIDELKRERQDIGAFIGKVNHFCVRNGVYINLIMCEALSDAMALERKQSEYNEEIKDCDCFVILFKGKAGSYTIEELTTACKHFKKFGHPEIISFYYEQVLEDADIKHLKKSKDILAEYQQAFHSYQTAEDIKRVILENILERTDFESELKEMNGRIVLGDKAVI